MRSYSTEPQIWGGTDPACDHTLIETPGLPPMTGGSGPASAKQVTNAGSQFGNAWAEQSGPRTTGVATASEKQNSNSGAVGIERGALSATCTRCGAWRGELGSEPTPEAFVNHLVEVFRGVKRVLRNDGVLFVNLSSSYFGSGKGPTGHNGIGDQATRQGFVGGDGTQPNPSRPARSGLAYGSDDTALADSPPPDSAYPDLCDGCQAVQPSSRIADNALPLAPVALPHEQTGHGNGHQGYAVASVAVAPLDALASTMPESSQQPPGYCRHCANCGACLAVLQHPARLPQACARRNDTPSNVEQYAPLADHISDTVPSSTASNTPPKVHKHYTIQWKNKDMVPTPFMFALAMVQDGWYLRQDIIWEKPNPMPESVTDRCTRSHEYVFHFSKSDRYYWDSDSIRETSVTNDPRRPYTSKGAWDVDGRPVEQQHGGQPRNGTDFTGRNARSVWEIATQATPLAHFATFPQALVRRCVAAGTSERGACAACGAPHRRVTERTAPTYWSERKDADFAGRKVGHTSPTGNDLSISHGRPENSGIGYRQTETTGWAPTCSHLDADVVPCRVLDVFSGAGTSVLVARQLGRYGIGIELSPEYCAMSIKRFGQMVLL